MVKPRIDIRPVKKAPLPVWNSLIQSHRLKLRKNIKGTSEEKKPVNTICGCHKVIRRPTR
jgi:hypothetical protein